MLTVFTSLIFSGAFVAASYAIGMTLLPNVARIADILRGAELELRPAITEPRRARVRMQVQAASARPAWREAA